MIIAMIRIRICKLLVKRKKSITPSKTRDDVKIHWKTLKVAAANTKREKGWEILRIVLWWRWSRCKNWDINSFEPFYKPSRHFINVGVWWTVFWLRGLGNVIAFDQLWKCAEIWTEIWKKQRGIFITMMELKFFGREMNELGAVLDVLTCWKGWFWWVN
jgi:hypothetical protein